MTYVYVLQSLRDKKRLYMGRSEDLRQRMKAHEGGGVQTSRRYGPMRLVYYEAFMDAQDAREREEGLKKFGGFYRSLLRRIRRSRLGVLVHGGAG